MSEAPARYWTKPYGEVVSVWLERTKEFAHRARIRNGPHSKRVLWQGPARQSALGARDDLTAKMGAGPTTPSKAVVENVDDTLAERVKAAREEQAA